MHFLARSSGRSLLAINDFSSIAVCCMQLCRGLGWTSDDVFLRTPSRSHVMPRCSFTYACFQPSSWLCMFSRRSRYR